ncbi:hypothetical protein [Leifsonia shinshuensis]
MYGGKIGGGAGPSVLTGGALVAGSQFSIAPYLLIGLGVLVAGFVIARIVYRNRRRRMSADA